jgi:hypothetical protein
MLFLRTSKLQTIMSTTTITTTHVVTVTKTVEKDGVTTTTTTTEENRVTEVKVSEERLDGDMGEDYLSNKVIASPEQDEDEDEDEDEEDIVTEQGSIFSQVLCGPPYGIETIHGVAHNYRIENVRDEDGKIIGRVKAFENFCTNQGDSGDYKDTDREDAKILCIEGNFNHVCWNSNAQGKGRTWTKNKPIADFDPPKVFYEGSIQEKNDRDPNWQKICTFVKIQ